MTARARGAAADLSAPASLERLSSNAPRLALRKPEAAAACGVSDETFDRYVRPHVPRVRLGSVTVWPVDGLAAFLAAQAQTPAADLGEKR